MDSTQKKSIHSLDYTEFVPHPDPDPYVLGPPGSASRSVCQRYGYEDPDPDSDQNDTDPHHCFPEIGQVWSQLEP